jgi:hypothetical protein
MERALRNVREARTLYKRCYARKFPDGSQPAMCYAWLRFEREEGRCGHMCCSHDHILLGLQFAHMHCQYASTRAHHWLSSKRQSLAEHYLLLQLITAWLHCGGVPWGDGSWFTFDVDTMAVSACAALRTTCRLASRWSQS